VGLTRDGLIVRYSYRDDDGTGTLAAEVSFNGFTGVSEAWFADTDLLLFAEQLHTYPLVAQRFHIAGGYGGDGGGEEHVGLSARAVGRRGLVGLLVHLATPTDRTMAGAVASDVRVEVLTSYECLGRFASELAQLVKGVRKEARLDAEVVGTP
jgi:hypothetical protein